MTQTNSIRFTAGAEAPPLVDVIKALQHISTIGNSVARSLANHKKSPVRWRVSAVERGSLVMELEPEIVSESVMESFGGNFASRVVHEIHSGMRMLESGTSVPESFDLESMVAARKLAEIASNGLGGGTFILDGEVVQVTLATKNRAIDAMHAHPHVIGAIDGELKLLNFFGDPSFAIESDLTGKRLGCIVSDAIDPDQLPALVNQRVRVHGVIHLDKRDSPKAIEARFLEVLPGPDQADPPSSFRGVLAS